MIHSKFLLLLTALLVVCLSGFEVEAADSDGNSFEVSIFMGTDVDAPTVPGNFSAAPVSESQIDLDWDASSDNVTVSGYQVFRDSVQIATTTLTAFSDTGLAVSTLYTYFVTAFDNSINISSSTVSLATSTLATPTPPATSTPTTTPDSGGTTGYYLVDIEIKNFTLTSYTTALDISFITNVYTQASIRWGRSPALESGYVLSDSLKQAHNTRIDGLEAGVEYWLEITLTDRLGRELVYRTRASTEAAVDREVPVNVSNFDVVLLGEQIRLVWQNPAITDFSKVRVLSSDYFYPTHFADGWLVYDGTAEQVLDNRQLAVGKGRYYTIFVYDSAGNISSGAVTNVFRRGIGQAPADGLVASSTEVISPPPLSVDFTTLEFFQGGERLHETLSEAGVVTLSAAADTLIRIPYERLPENLKTIVVSLTDPDDGRQFAFLLRVNKDKSYYEAIIGPLARTGRLPLELSVFDFKTQALATAVGLIELTGEFEIEPEPPIGSSIGGLMRYDGLLLAGVAFILLILLFWQRKRRAVPEDKIV